MNYGLQQAHEVRPFVGTPLIWALRATPVGLCHWPEGVDSLSYLCGIVDVWLRKRRLWPDSFVGEQPQRFDPQENPGGRGGPALCRDGPEAGLPVFRQREKDNQ
jgi:hypothetical protein